MKTPSLITFATIAVASMNVLANVIPTAVVATDKRSSPAGELFRRLNADENEILDRRQGNSTGAASDLPLPVPAPVSPPVKRGEEKGKDYQDILWLNFALFLEYFENAFYERGLSRYNEEAFRRAGYPDWVRGRYLQIAEHERYHKLFIESAITASGSPHVGPCRYEFYDNDVRAFVDASAAIETIATGAYTGLLQFFNNRAYVTAGASILAVEARQAAWINSAVRKLNPWNAAFETPLTPNAVLTLLSNFFNFENCPKENHALLPPGVHPYPRLAIAPILVPGQPAEISFPYPQIGGGERLYVAFLSGAETIFAPLQEKEDGKDKDNKKRYFVEIPRDLAGRGTVYVIVVRGRENIGEVRLEDEFIVAGPGITMFPFDAWGKPINGW
ncbi:unnamed protein product [Cyclocybe aegerita]|uniref:Uncharacterized protein n=1 Tax=Cyclocybe aegerita TaxID=1973307 RepID=A0A8S0W3D2_CYCAE|nr:unnamed protein product [Cyclocybe aegerita]